MFTIFCLLALFSILLLNKVVFKGKIFDHPKRRLHLLLSLAIGIVLVLLRVIPYDIDEAFGIPIVAFFSNTFPLSYEFLLFLFGPSFFVFVVINIFFMPKSSNKVLYLLLVILPFFIFWPKFGENLSCKGEIPANNAVALWKGTSARFVRANYTSYPAEYRIYDAQTNKPLEERVSLSEFSNQNKCLGIKENTLCSGIVIAKCEIPPKDISEFSQY